MATTNISKIERTAREGYGARFLRELPPDVLGRFTDAVCRAVKQHTRRKDVSDLTQDALLRLGHYVKAIGDIDRAIKKAAGAAFQQARLQERRINEGNPKRRKTVDSPVPPRIPAPIRKIVCQRKPAPAPQVIPWSVVWDRMPAQYRPIASDCAVLGFSRGGIGSWVDVWNRQPAEQPAEQPAVNVYAMAINAIADGAGMYPVESDGAVKWFSFGRASRLRQEGDKWILEKYNRPARLTRLADQKA